MKKSKIIVTNLHAIIKWAITSSTKSELHKFRLVGKLTR